MFLTADEVRDLTGKVRNQTQVAALRHMGIEHRVRPDGSVAVLRAHVESSLGLLAHSKGHEQEAVLNLEWMNG
ncbi:DUF4224 domain-containing protein [Polynucleobacter sp. UB-Piko-W3]|uniref:DUF4224 domain-containing protein n=1 Tax=Polynucleobacter sp. UB-Piko-W3 TaxID=1819735 RepID=UPI001C0E3151|nr:DUF4224 domain-containing protein [Polynucleobacter sp. UB-Piko-W3]MBU3554860.1 DUF4224 domain-containing protein [Polynucleobacter sp. UB-Piko-W3]